MFSEDFFTEYFKSEDIVKPSKQRMLSVIMATFLNVGSQKDSPLTKTDLLKAAKITRAQFYYAVSGLPALMAHLMNAGMLLSGNLSEIQRDCYIVAFYNQKLPRRMSFPDALNLLLLKNYPIRQSDWNSGYLSNYSGQMVMRNEVSGEIVPWTPNNTHIMARDWELAIPSRIPRGSAWKLNTTTSASLLEV